MNDIVREVLTSRVYDVAQKTPLEKAQKLSRQLGAHVYLKREDMQPVHSFKLRGAYNKICRLSEAEKQCGVIAASAGNHAQGVALAAQKLGISALIVMPRTTPAIKIDAVKAYGAELVLIGDNYSEAAEECARLVKQTKRVFIHPFDDPLVIAGQGTIGQEIIEQLPDVTHIFVPVGGGGLIAGIAHYVKAVRPDVMIIGVEPVDSAAMTKSLAKGERVTLKHVGIFADGVAVKQVGEHTFAAAQRLVDSCITVTTDQICSAINDSYEAARTILEPSGALALAGLKTYPLPSEAHAVAICSGANVSFERLQQIAERTLIGSGREALIAVTLPERPGAFLEFCDKIVGRRSITEFSYRFRERNVAHVLAGISVKDADDKAKLLAQMKTKGFDHVDLSNDEIAKEHVRHMIGGPGPGHNAEMLYHVEFPERPGALGEFLHTVGTQWNVTLFHYRSTASDIGRVLIGFETTDQKNLEERLDATGFEYTRAGNNPGLLLFS
ncbi:threonine ammonia-lyase, biosynthetic [Candidatus Saccharibacteria bacterium]|nr:MAG: threonine ammonia-lyase, biosynthetic [Candidatus Saccharibacteria bacterium]